MRLTPDDQVVSCSFIVGGFHSLTYVFPARGKCVVLSQVAYPFEPAPGAE